MPDSTLDVGAMVLSGGIGECWMAIGLDVVSRVRSIGWIDGEGALDVGGAIRFSVGRVW